MKKQPKQPRVPKFKQLKRTAEVLDRIQGEVVGTGSATLLLNSYQADLEESTTGNTDGLASRRVLGYGTLERARHFKRAAEMEKPRTERIRAISFDGRQDKTLGDVSGPSKRKRMRREDHESIVAWPGKVFIGHFKPSDQSGKSIAKGVYERTTEKHSLEDLEIEGGDNTNPVTGWRKGAFRHLELILERPLQRNPCFIHMCELPARALLAFYDGPTTGPTSWSGPIGKVITGSIDELPVVNFEPVPNEKFPHVDQDRLKELTTDQRTFVEVGQAVMSGVVSRRVADTKIGTMRSDRWLNTFSRTLRLVQEKI